MRSAEHDAAARLWRKHVAFDGMTRSEIRDLKRAVRKGIAADASERDANMARTSASILFEHSVNCGHKRLSVIRLAEAIRTGANVTRAQWSYCEEVVSELEDDALLQVVADAISAVGIPCSANLVHEK
jgi:hypothetical protein